MTLIQMISKPLAVSSSFMLISCLPLRLGFMCRQMSGHMWTLGELVFLFNVARVRVFQTAAHDPLDHSFSSYLLNDYYVSDPVEALGICGEKI